MKILTFSGSSIQNSNNNNLLDKIGEHFSQQYIYRYNKLDQLPLFKPDLDQAPFPKEVTDWRNSFQNVDAVIISTPEYIHNIPALLKNAFEWITSSGELNEKRVLPITFTPHAPRGEKAMQSMLWSLQALNANIVAQLPLYQNEIQFNGEGTFIEDEHFEVLKEAINLLVN